jgi:hypothetical protein
MLSTVDDVIHFSSGSWGIEPLIPERWSNSSFHKLENENVARILWWSYYFWWSPRSLNLTSCDLSLVIFKIYVQNNPHTIEEVEQNTVTCTEITTQSTLTISYETYRIEQTSPKVVVIFNN